MKASELIFYAILQAISDAADDASTILVVNKQIDFVWFEKFFCVAAKKKRNLQIIFSLTIQQLSTY